jgi:hypothetical protein
MLEYQSTFLINLKDFKLSGQENVVIEAGLCLRRLSQNSTICVVPQETVFILTSGLIATQQTIG